MTLEAKSLLDLPNELLLSITLYIYENNSIFNYVSTCRTIYTLFVDLYKHNLDAIRLEYLNESLLLDQRSSFGTRRERGSRLLNLFGYSQNKHVNDYSMWTYDLYMINHSLIDWPKSYFEKGTTYPKPVQVFDEKEDDVYGDEKYKPEDYKLYNDPDLRFMPNRDTYEMSIHESVKRKVTVAEIYDRKIRKSLQVKEEKIIEDINYIERDRVVFLDTLGIDPRRRLDYFSKYSEKIARLFERPENATYSAFQLRWNQMISKSAVANLLTQIIFDYNKTTTSKCRFIVAGGAVLNALAMCGCRDVDIFTIRNGETEKTIMKDLKWILLEFETKAKEKGLVYNILKTNGTLSICSPSQFRERLSSYPNGPLLDSDIISQFILRKVDCIEGWYYYIASE